MPEIRTASEYGGCETRIRSWLRKQSMASEMAGLVEKQTGYRGIEGNDAGGIHELSRVILEFVGILKHRVVGQEIDTTFVRPRVGTRFEAVSRKVLL